MKIVIDIPDKDYEHCKMLAETIGEVLIHHNPSDRIKYFVGVGTPLPKGHGRLIDAELLLNEIHDLSTEPMADLRFRLRNAPTTIEADTESKEDDLDSMLEDLWNATESEEEK